MSVKPIRVAFILSLCLHAGLVGVTSFFAPKATRVSPASYAVTLIQEAPKKNIKNLRLKKLGKKKLAPVHTKKTKRAQAKPKKSPEKKKAKKDEAYKEVQKAIARLSQQEAEKSICRSLADIKKKLAEEKQIKRGTPAQVPTRHPSPNNLPSRGCEVSESYKAQLWTLIKSRWSMPEMKEKNLETRIVIRLYKDGSIQDIKVIKRSGDSSFDDSALRAIQRVDHFPPFPPSMDQDSDEVEVLFVPDRSGASDGL